jgi:hypothetical protein
MDEPAGESSTSNDALLRHDILLKFLADRDVPCPQCGYNLRNLVSDVCPECGERLALGVRMVEPRQAAMLAGLIGLSSGAGLNGLLLIYGLIRFVPRDRMMYRFMGINAAGLIALGLLIFLWLRYWRWIRARQASVRLVLAGACWLASLVDLIVFTAVIR